MQFYPLRFAVKHFLISKNIRATLVVVAEKLQSTHLIVGKLRNISQNHDFNRIITSSKTNVADKVMSNSGGL